MARKYKRLRFNDRQTIEKMLTEEKSIAEIALRLGVHRDTIYKEIHRSGKDKDTYTAESGQKAI